MLVDRQTTCRVDVEPIRSRLRVVRDIGAVVAAALPRDAQAIDRGPSVDPIRVGIAEPSNWLLEYFLAAVLPRNFDGIDIRSADNGHHEPD